MLKGSSGHQACAACKHQRRKCTPECLLAPFFPAEHGDKFKAVHKVFGVSNVVKLIKSLDNEEKQTRAIESICWEAEWRQLEPVEGCWAEFKRLNEELHRLRRELAEIHMCAKVYCAKNALPHGSCNNNNNNNNHNNSGNGHSCESCMGPTIGGAGTYGLIGLEGGSEGGDHVTPCPPAPPSLNQHYYFQ
ncbi:hypothetical protein AMTR_s00021p00187850, partial [Amborella trichopoda]